MSDDEINKTVYNIVYTIIRDPVMTFGLQPEIDLIIDIIHDDKAAISSQCNLGRKQFELAYTGYCCSNAL